MIPRAACALPMTFSRPNLSARRPKGIRKMIPPRPSILVNPSAIALSRPRSSRNRTPCTTGIQNPKKLITIARVRVLYPGIVQIDGSFSAPWPLYSVAPCLLRSLALRVLAPSLLVPFAFLHPETHLEV